MWGVIAGAISPLSPFLIVLSSGGMTINWSVVALMCASGATFGLASAQLSLRAARGRFYAVPMPSSGSKHRFGGSPTGADASGAPYFGERDS